MMRMKMSLTNLQKLLQIQKIGYTTQPDDGNVWQRGTELTPQWESSDAASQPRTQKIGRDIGNQSYGLPALGSKDHDKILDTMSTVTDNLYSYPKDDPLEDAHYYLNSIKNQKPNDSRGMHNYNEVDMHMKGHRALATVHNIMNYGEDYLDHPDAIKYREHKRNPEHSFEDARAARARGEEYDVPYYSYRPPMEGIAHSYNGQPYESIDDVEEMTIPLEEYHRAMAFRC